MAGAPMLVMKCDHGAGGCRVEPVRAPRIVIPSRTPFLFGHRPIRIMTTLHYCQPHIGALKLEDVLNDRMKARVEQHAMQRRPPLFRPDFDKASIEYVLLTTPEYREFLLSISLKRGAA